MSCLATILTVNYKCINIFQDFVHPTSPRPFSSSQSIRWTPRLWSRRSRRTMTPRSCSHPKKVSNQFPGSSIYDVMLMVELGNADRTGNFRLRMRICLNRANLNLPIQFYIQNTNRKFWTRNAGIKKSGKHLK